MASGNLLVEPSKQEPGNERQQALWTQTWKRLERFLPGLYADLYPDVPAEAAAPPSQSSDVQS